MAFVVKVVILSVLAYTANAGLLTGEHSHDSYVDSAYSAPSATYGAPSTAYGPPALTAPANYDLSGHGAAIESAPLVHSAAEHVEADIINDGSHVISHGHGPALAEGALVGSGPGYDVPLGARYASGAYAGDSTIIGSGHGISAANVNNGHFISGGPILNGGGLAAGPHDDGIINGPAIATGPGLTGPALTGPGLGGADGALLNGAAVPIGTTTAVGAPRVLGTTVSVGRPIAGSTRYELQSVVQNVIRRIPVEVTRHVQVAVPHPVPYPVRQEVRVPVPQPYPVNVDVVKHVPYPVYKTEHVEVERPVPYEVIKKVPVEVIRKVPVPVERPYEVIRKVHVPVEKHVEVPVPVWKPYPIHIIKHVTHYKKKSCCW